jgi:hypothetical protein
MIICRHRSDAGGAVARLVAVGRLLRSHARHRQPVVLRHFRGHIRYCCLLVLLSGAPTRGAIATSVRQREVLLAVVGWGVDLTSSHISVSIQADQVVGRRRTR